MLVLDANNPLLNVSNFHLLDLIAACAMIITSAYYSNKLVSMKIRKENKVTFDSKADLTYVKDMKAELEKDIVGIKSAIDTMNSKNSRQHGNMLSEISEANKGIARIEGYLKAKQEK